MPRIIRVLEYEGSLEWLRSVMADRHVKIEQHYGGGVVREGFVKLSEDLGEYLVEDD